MDYLAVNLHWTEAIDLLAPAYLFRKTQSGTFGDYITLLAISRLFDAAGQHYKRHK